MEGVFIILLYFQAGVSFAEEAVWAVCEVGVVELCIEVGFAKF